MMAGRLPDSFFDDLRSRLDIVDVVSGYVQLRQKGRRFWGLCPFHNEKTASFSVDSDAQMYYCFGCHEGGTAIHFVMQLEHMEFMEAVAMLAERARLPMPDTKDQPSNAPSRELKERLYEINREAAGYYHSLLYEPEGAEVLAYLHRRGLDDGDIKRFGLGASPPGWTDTLDKMLQLGFSEDELLKAGLVGRKESRAYDMFRQRAMFPIISAQGKVLGFGGRAMGDAMPKYLNTQDTPVFNKRQGLYALNIVRKEGNQKRLVLVEGYMDVLSLRKAGVTGVVATLGTALTIEQAKLIKRYAPEVWVSYDGDSAGQKAILRALDIFNDEDMRAKVLVFPDDQDPDDFVRQYGIEGFNRLKPMDPIDYRMQSAKQDYDLADQQGRTDYAIRCCEMLKSVKNPVELQNYIQRLMMDTGFERDVLISQIGTLLLKPEKKGNIRRRTQVQTQLEEYERAERMLLLLMANKSIPDRTVKVDDFITPLYADVAQRLLSGAGVAKILESLQDSDLSTVASALISEITLDDKSALQAAGDCLLQIQMHRIESTKTQINEQLKLAEGAERSQLILEVQKLTQQLDRLKAGRKGWSV